MTTISRSRTSSAPSSTSRTRRGRSSSPSRSAIRCRSTPTCPTSPSRAARRSSRKRKIAQYLKNAEFKRLYDHGAEIAARIGHVAAAETFNPVIVDFYREVGYLPDAIINYLMLLGWSLDDKTEDFTREEMIKHFTLERVTKAPASFDPQKALGVPRPLHAAAAAEAEGGQDAAVLAEGGPRLRSGALRGRPEADADRRSLRRPPEDGRRHPGLRRFLLRARRQARLRRKGLCKSASPRRRPRSCSRKFRAVLATVEPFEVGPLEEALKKFVEAAGHQDRRHRPHAPRRRHRQERRPRRL